MAIKVGMVSLGCPKNQVDAEVILAQLKNEGFLITNDPTEADAVIINTCGFIDDAKRESIETILEFCQLKENGKLKCIVVSGCLAQRYQEEVAKEIPEADVIVGIGSNHEIGKAIKKALGGEHTQCYGSLNCMLMNGERVLSTPPYSAYLKIADGCDNWCSYCAIPLIRGRFKSRTMEDVLAEAKKLADDGVKEINLIAQDTTRYGEDLYGKVMLPQLLDKLCEIDGIRWIRILYGYPERITDELLETIARQEKVLNYIDIPMQHASGAVLKRMNRRSNAPFLKALVEKIRAKVPNVTIRTTVIAGFPGETEEDFEELIDFIKTMKIDRLGCFAYSREEDTAAYDLDGQLDEETKERRAEIVNDEQFLVMSELNSKKIGTKVTVLVEGYDEESHLYYGRSEADAPDIDSKVFLDSDKEFEAGTFVPVTITDITTFDLVGQVAEEE